MEAIDGRVTCEIGIAMAVERLLRDGFAVAVPLVDDGYDLLAFDQRRCWRLQVKASASRGTNRYRIAIGRGKNRTLRYSPRHVDAIVCVNVRTREMLCVPVSRVRGRSYLRWAECRKWGDFRVLHGIKHSA